MPKEKKPKRRSSDLAELLRDLQKQRVEEGAANPLLSEGTAEMLAPFPTMPES